MGSESICVVSEPLDKLDNQRVAVFMTLVEEGCRTSHHVQWLQDAFDISICPRVSSGEVNVWGQRKKACSGFSVDVDVDGEGHHRGVSCP